MRAGIQTLIARLVLGVTDAAIPLDHDQHEALAFADAGENKYLVNRDYDLPGRLAIQKAAHRFTRSL